MSTTENKTPANNTPEVFKVIGDWAAQSIKLKEKFPQLTDNDLKLEVGKDHEILGRVQARLNKKRKEVINMINNQPKK